jgi:hypothetical protein
MRETGRRAIAMAGATVVLTAAGVGAVAQAAGTDRQMASYRFTTTQPGAPTGFSLSVDFHDPANPGGKPYSVARMIVRGPAGTVIDTSLPDQCKATDAQLLAQGATACPAGSRIGGGTIVSDTGSTGAFPPRFVTNRVDNFNNANELIGVADATDSPVVPGVTRTVTRSPINGTTTISDFPAFPGNPPPDSFSAISTIRLAGSAYVRGARAYARTPPTCPSSGSWIVELTFTYRDGVAQTVHSPTPCSRVSTGGGSGASGGKGGSSCGRTKRTARRSHRRGAGRPGRRGKCVRR